MDIVLDVLELYTYFLINSQRGGGRQIKGAQVLSFTICESVLHVEQSFVFCRELLSKPKF